MTPSQQLATIADRLWQLKLEEPVLRQSAGLAVEKIPRSSLAEARTEANKARAMLSELDAIDTQSLDSRERNTLGFLASELATLSAAETQWHFQTAVAPYSSMSASYYAQTVIHAQPIQSASDMERVLSLWVDLAGMVGELARRARDQAAQGRRLARPAIGAALDAMKGQRALIASLMGGDHLPQVFRDSLRAIRDKEVLPAIDGWIDSISAAEYAAAAPAQCGLMYWPGGEEEYRRLVRMHLTRDETPEELHEIGLREVDRITEAMRETRSGLGFDGDEAVFHSSLAANPRMYARTPEDLEIRYRGCMSRMNEVIHRWFRELPRSPADVARLPAAAEAGMTYGYYDRPSSDGGIGTYRYNGTGLAQRSLLQAAALIYHELVPGHHFHLSRQMEAVGLPLIRRHATGLTVFNEGWAEYASGLAGEMGLYDDPLDRYGRLLHERFVAQRLVIDTGMNALGWTLERAREFMKANTLEGDAQIQSETLRYSTDMPAQALAYRYGYLAFMQMREAARKRLGAGFDIRDFHEAILSEGALPLPVLQQHLERALPQEPSHA
jgi:uncharacterized protein (DUF885 family)